MRPDALGDRIEHLLDLLRATVKPDAWAQVSELLELLTELYGAGLARIVELAAAGDGDGGLLARMAGDDLVAGLLVLHGLHPDSFTNRVQRALAEVRPYLATHAGDVELTGVDEDLGAVRLRMMGSCDGCPSSSITLKLAVERAIYEAAPEVTLIEVEGDDQPEPDVPVGTPVHLRRKPAPAFVDCPVPVPGASASP